MAYHERTPQLLKTMNSGKVWTSVLQIHYSYNLAQAQLSNSDIHLGFTSELDK